MFDAGVRQGASANFAALGLPPGASRQEVVAAYRRLASECHPDRFHESSDEERSAAAERFRLVTRAYEELLAERGAD
jgi:DnaJ like chaperone protein